MKHSANLDILRSFAVLGVVIHHLLISLFGGLGLRNNRLSILLNATDIHFAPQELETLKAVHPAIALLHAGYARHREGSN
jgi:hypothetical protein